MCILYLALLLLYGLRYVKLFIKRIWMNECLNPAKTELIWLGSPRHLQACTADFMLLRWSGVTVRSSRQVRDLGVIVNSDLSLAAQISRVTSVCLLRPSVASYQKVASIVAQPYWYNIEPIFNQWGILRIYWPRYNDCILTSCQYQKVVYSRYLAN